ncbi:virion structural protein [Pectobacterium phage MA12]|uniref:Virion structural protein n=1 Tax=Pectobacterium phage MA12 TaxID=2686474 RepID=A0A6B9RNV8_9CAUD|nr:tail protein [Pectobacterium phage MA11]YP_010000225.1 tail protein [Pectobacterium phage MA12]QGF21051.1 virion structural protein [Pectobacterium phage MA11]QHI00830.1 virion structural protein [Pectobacterium phage MA12]
MGGKGSKKAVVGYKYFITMHVAICHGEIDAIRGLWWSDKKAWEGTISKPSDGTSATFWETNTGLFGGESSEGGVDGLVEVGFGGRNQQMIGILPNGTYDAAVMPTLGGRVGSYWRPAWPEMACQYRGIAVLFLHGNYIGNNAYMKEVSVDVERFWRDWFPETAQIGGHANPAHIIYESVIDRNWGLGYDVGSLDDATFRAAAQTLFNEGLGLSFVWDSEQDLQAFIDDVKSCIDASFYPNRRSGKWQLKLNRPGDTPKLTITPDNATLTTFTRKSLGETFNEISVKYTNPETEDYVSVTVQDLANIESQGRVVSTTKEYIGVREEGLAVRLGQRDLQVSSATLATAEAICNREAYDIYPGDVVLLTWPEDGIVNLRMRAVEVTVKAGGDDKISMKLVEDVFGQANGSFNGISPPGWVDPRQPATLFDIVQPWEFPFWFVVQGSGISVNSLPTLAAYGTSFAVGTNTDARAVRLFGRQNTPDGPAWVLENIGPQTPTATTTADLAPAPTSVFSIDPGTARLFNNIETTSFLVFIGGGRQEIMLITAVSSDLLTFTVTRGLMDTHPYQWPAGTRVFFMGENGFVADYTQRSLAETVQYRPAMQTSIDQMDVNSVPTSTITMRGRYELPYSVANVRIEGAYWPASINADGVTFEVTWAARNRLLQDAATQVPWDAGSITPEAGTLTHLDVLDAGGTAVVQLRNMTGLAAAVPTDNLTSGTYTVVVWTTRDGRMNFQAFRHTLTIDIPTRDTGYGNSYGFDYGE